MILGQRPRREGAGKAPGAELQTGKIINWEMCDGDFLPLEILSRRLM